MKKFKEWFHAGGQELIETIFYIFSFFLVLLFCALIGAFIRGLPLFYEKLAEVLITMGNIQ